MEKLVIDAQFWQGKKVLITGHTGFKGSWLSLWLQSLGADVLGLSLEPESKPNLYQQAKVEVGMTSIIGNICDLDLVKNTIQQFQPEIIFHLAAQALVRESYNDPVETYQTNVMGTMNVLEAIRECDNVKATVMVTTDKCYDNKEWLWPYRENDRLGGHDLYSSSKACAEILIDSYRRSFFTDAESASIASVRAGNVIGGGDWAKDRLIPDIVSAYNMQQTLMIRYPSAIRPWQHVLEPLHGYLSLAEKLYEDSHSGYAQAWNFGPLSESVKSVSWIADYFSQRWKAFNWQVDGNEQLHEATILKLDCTKAHEQLAWYPKWTIEQALEKIISWTERFNDNDNMKQVCLEQIEQFMSEKV
jgi:CDP-glucose 4,6-dehydratase